MAKIHTVYDAMEFPPWSYQEYPKHVYPDPKNPKAFVEVNNAEEERAALSGDKLEDAEFERTKLLKIAEIKGVVIDGRWSDKRIRDAITKAGYDPTENPFE